MYENLKAELRRRNLSYNDFARIAGVLPGTIARRMSGMADFKLQEIVRIADYLQCSTDYLIGREVKGGEKFEQSNFVWQSDQRC